MDTYKQLCTEFYDLDKPFAPADKLQFYLRYVEKANGPILEPMCGTGRFLIPILERGYDIEGFDVSPHMLAVCRQKCHEKGLTPKLHQLYLHEMKFDKQYKLIFIPSGSFGLIINKNEAKQGLEILYQHLAKNGKLVFEVETVRTAPKNLGIWQHAVKSHQRKDGSQIRLSTLPSYEKETHILKILCRYELIQDNKIQKTEEEDFCVRLYHDHEMDEWLKETGFKNIMRYTSYDRTLSKDPELIIYECDK